MIHQRAWMFFPFLFLLGANGQAGLDALPSAYHFREHQFPVVDDSGHCGRAANGSAKLGKVRFAQTHLMEPSWPFFYLSGGRPALIAVNLEGTGNAPDVRLTVKVKGVQVGSACLAGPTVIPPAAADTAPSLSSLYTMTLPKEWVMPGMSVVVESGSDKREFTPEQLDVKSPTEVNLLIAQMELLDLDDSVLAKTDKEPLDLLANLAGALSASATRIGHFPVTVKFDKMLFRGPEGRPLLGCREDVVDRTDCEDVFSNVDIGDVNLSVLQFAEMVSKATGHYYEEGYIYANTALWLGGKAMEGRRVAEGSGFSGVLLHEVGHSLGLHHWHEVYAVPPANQYQFTYPYGGPNGDGGGRGNTWNWEANSNEFVSPRCQLGEAGKIGWERKDRMSYLGLACNEARKGLPGPWEGLSDFSAYSILQFLNGRDSAKKGRILDRDTLRDFQVPSFFGHPTLIVGASGRPSLVRSETQRVIPDNWEYEGKVQPPFLMPAREESPQYLVYGRYHPTVAKANVIYKPIPFIGNGVDLIDPTDPRIFADLKTAWRGVYGTHFLPEHDITLRFTYADGSRKSAIYPHQRVSSEDLMDASRPWEDNLLTFALLVPAAKSLRKVEVLRRPFRSCDCNSTVPGDIAVAGSTITADNFLDSADLLLERNFTDVDPPTKIVSKPTGIAHWESIGGLVTVRRLDGRVEREFALEPGTSLERRVREIWKRPGVWIVQMKTKSGSFSRTIAIQ